jgi:hypothetical protein
MVKDRGSKSPFPGGWFGPSRAAERATTRLAKSYQPTLKCCLCGSVIDDLRQAHNAAPLASGFCCEACNTTRVLPARIAALTPPQRRP